MSLATLILTLSSCSLPSEYRGNAPSSEEVEQLVVQQSNKEDVRKTLGSPSSINAFDEDKWYYISQVQRNHSLFASQNVQQTVLALDFNEGGVLDKAEVMTLDDAQKVNPERQSTKIFGRTSSLFEDIFGTIGRFGVSSPN